MSWLSIQLPNPFKSLNFSDDHHDDDNQQHQPDEQEEEEEEEEFNQNASQLSETDAGGGGVKDDLSAIGDSISRRFRGVAAFLAPPSTAATSSSAAVEGIRSDLAEIGGTFKSTLSLFSNPNKAVSEISRFASDFLQLNEENTQNFDDRVRNDDDNDDDDGCYDDEEEDQEEYGAGVSDEVIEFARQISDRSELWIDFPLPLDHLVFDMSEAQSEHASIVEQLVPDLAALKNKISSVKSEQQFWMIYFILLLPRLNDDDLELLSTPQIVEARETLLMMLREKKNEESSSESPQSYSSSALDNKVDHAEPENISSVRDVTTIENPNSLSKESNESVTVDKIAGVQDARSATSTQCDPVAKADDPKLSKDPSSEAKGHENLKSFQTEDDVSFSDLEEDDDSDLRNREPSSGSSQIKRNSSTEGSTDWVRLHEGTRGSHVRGQSGSRERDSEGEESTDWLTVDDFDP